jgi:hypothetical protein
MLVGLCRRLLGDPGLADTAAIVDDFQAEMQRVRAEFLRR